jgi:glycosyltransferase involved in cell wall biosynthesis
MMQEGRGPKVSILDFDVSNNSLGRAYILAQALSAKYDVEICGPAKNGKIWEPLASGEFKVTVLPGGSLPVLLFRLPRILKAIDGDIVYAVKPRFTSFGYALLKKLFSRTPVVLDIDDWELGFYYKDKVVNRLTRLLHVTNPNGFCSTLLMHKLIRLADARTTVSSFLQEKYGGTLIPHAKDTEAMDPRKHAPAGELAGLAGKKKVMFLGTPRKPKGVDDALEAVLGVDDPSVVMVIVGGKPGGKHERRLQEKARDRLHIIGQIPMHKVPEYLKAADVVVVPQKRNAATRGQLPSKLLDAMAMARPIVSTAVADIPQILDGCALVVEPERPEEMSGAIKRLLEQPAEAARLGNMARQRCKERYSMAVVRARLERIMGHVAEGRPVPDEP